MDNSVESPWVYIGECPICVNGIARVRTCAGGAGVHFFAVCDECEAMWVEPDTSSQIQFADAVDPRCPICSAALYGEQSHWSVPQELDQTEWSALAILAWPSAQAGADEDVDPNDRTTGC